MKVVTPARSSLAAVVPRCSSSKVLRKPMVFCLWACLPVAGETTRPHSLGSNYTGMERAGQELAPHAYGFVIA